MGAAAGRWGKDRGQRWLDVCKMEQRRGAGRREDAMQLVDIQRLMLMALKVDALCSKTCKARGPNCQQLPESSQGRLVFNACVGNRDVPKR